MIAMKFTIELDIGLSFLLQAALPQLVTDRETKTHGHHLASGPWQSPGFGPPTSRMRQLALERSHHAQYRSDRLRPVVAGFGREDASLPEATATDHSL
jgi:hypothetical protein